MSSNGYGVVWPSFWTGSTGRQLRGDVTTQLVAVYLMTCSHKNSLGIYRCPPAYITTDIGVPLEGASKALRRLCEVGFCAIDETNETIWVFEMAQYQIGEALKAGDNRLKFVHRLFAEIENEQMQQAFFKKYGAAYQLPEPTARPEKVRPFEGASKPLDSPSEANNYNYGNNHNSNYQESIAHPSDRAETENRNPKPEAKSGKPMVAGFDEFWSICPVKKSKAAALKAWPKAVATAAPAEIIAGMRRYARERAGQDPRYTKHPATWLNAGCWSDESTLIGGGAGPPGFGDRQRPNGGFTEYLLQQEYLNGTVTINHDDTELADPGH